jgi:hypothetical protein
VTAGYAALAPGWMLHLKSGADTGVDATQKMKSHRRADMFTPAQLRYLSARNLSLSKSMN